MAALLAGFSPGAAAADLYQGEVQVEDQSAQARSAGLADALAQVLVRVSGTPSAPRTSGIAAHLSRASQYVQQYQYRTENRVPPGGDEPQRLLLLSARFAPSAVDDMLREAGLPLWGRERPSVLVWLVMQEAGTRELVGSDRPRIVGAVERAADRRGVPVLFPVLDLQDQGAVSERELWGGFTEPLLEASGRYGTETFLLGRVSGSEDERSGRWTLHDQGREAHFETSAETVEEVLAAGVEDAADRLGERYAVRAGEQRGSSVTVAVSGVRSLSDYDRVLDYFAGMSLVRQARLESVKGDTLGIRLATSAGLDRLDQAVRLGRILDEADESLATPDPGAPSYHRRYVLRQ